MKPSALSAEDCQDLLTQLKDPWAITPKGHLVLNYAFPDFRQAMAFAQAIADLAEQEGHHPDLSIRWGACGVELWTHSVNGLSELDFKLAAKIEAIQCSKGHPKAEPRPD